MPFLLDSIREYIAEHEDRELARKFVELYADTRLHELCSKHTDLNKAAFRTGMAYMSMEVIGQYFFPETEAQKWKAAEILPNPMTRTEATDYIDTIRAAMQMCGESRREQRGKKCIPCSSVWIKRKSSPSRNISSMPTTRIWLAFYGIFCRSRPSLPAAPKVRCQSTSRQE